MINFGVTQYGKSIQKVKPRYTLATGLEVHSEIPGLVPKLYEMEACRAGGYRYWIEWQDLTHEQKATEVAKYMTSRHIETLQKDAEIEQIERNRRRAGRK